MNRRLRVAVRGAVQGVGFRPYVYRLARELGLAGWVRNGPAGVLIEVEGAEPALTAFRVRLPAEAPARAFIQGTEATVLDPVGFDEFAILPSLTHGEPRAFLLPDIATCPECVREIFDPANRRFRYAFTNCTQCGPRYTIIDSLPYDRPRTSMRGFPMCPECRREYEDPENRRFHAQPNACPVCGPRLRLESQDGRQRSTGDAALREAAEMVQCGGILAMKGLGGFHLIVDARNESAVRRLRDRKRREAKPLAIMVPSLEAARALASVGPLEAALLASPEAPIVLLEARPGAGVAPSVAPGNPYLGIMLPYTPLHHLFLADLAFPVVATSGNLSEEPMCTEEGEARMRLAGIADLFLAHERPILRAVDDSVARVVLGREMLVRRARGYAPLPVTLPLQGEPVLAVGGHLKNSVALGLGREAFLSPHVGDLDNPHAGGLFHRTIEDLQRLYGIRPASVVCDAHPDYHSTRFANALGLPVQRVQHHFAHVCSVLAENEVEGPVLGVSWDGTGYGDDGTVWGGEFLRTDGCGGYVRLAHLRRFRLPGGDAAVREPRRSAIAVLFELLGASVVDQSRLAPLAAFQPAERRVLCRMLEGGLNAPWTTSAGRLFDALASLTGLAQFTRFEGEAAMALEYSAHAAGPSPEPPRGAPTLQQSARRMWLDTTRQAAPWVLDWEPLVRAALHDVSAGVPAGAIARMAHELLAEGIVQVATLAAEPRVALSGGCFQNRLLLEETVNRLRAAGFSVIWHQRVPTNDGGIALGQLAAARATSALAGRASVLAVKEEGTYVSRGTR